MSSSSTWTRASGSRWCSRTEAARISATGNPNGRSSPRATGSSPTATGSTERGPWPAKGDYSADAHAADLVAIIRRLESGPVHLVGFSTAIALRAALREPGLVRSLTIIEPNVPWLLEGDPEGEAVLAWWRDENERVRAEAAGDAERRARLWFELVNNRGPGTFDAQPEALRRMWLDNFNAKRPAAPPPEPLTCEQLGAITTPTLVVGAEYGMPLLAADRRRARRVYRRQPLGRHPLRDALHELPRARRLQRSRPGLPLAPLSWTHAAYPAPGR